MLEILKDIEIGEPIYEGYIYPVRLKDGVVFDEEYELFNEAVKNGNAKVREKENASVREVIIEIKGKKKVIIPEGEVIIGGKQTRVVSRTYVLEEGEHEIPVFCVERGRWHGGDVFRSEGIIMDSFGKFLKIKKMGYTQHYIWRYIHTLLHKYRLQSETESYEKVYEHFGNIKIDYQPSDEDVGILIPRSGLWIEIFTHKLWRNVAIPIIKSHIMGLKMVEENEEIYMPAEELRILPDETINGNQHTTINGSRLAIRLTTIPKPNSKLHPIHMFLGIAPNPLPKQGESLHEQWKRMERSIPKHPEYLDHKDIYKNIYDFHKQNWYLVHTHFNSRRSGRIFTSPNYGYILTYLEFIDNMPKPKYATREDMVCVFGETIGNILEWSYHERDVNGIAMHQYAKMGLRKLGFSGWGDPKIREAYENSQLYKKKKQIENKVRNTLENLSEQEIFRYYIREFLNRLSKLGSASRRF